MAALRCPECRKFAQVDPDSEPDCNEDFDEATGILTVTARMVNHCADCGHELSEHEFTLEFDFSKDIAAHDCPEKDTGVGWTTEVELCERTIREHPPNAKVRTKFYGIQVDAKLACNCGEVLVHQTLSDEVKASLMEALV